MVEFCPLFSGSSGNATYIKAPGGGVLIDTGVSARRLLLALEAVGASHQEVSAILLTHDHSDHIKGLRVLQKQLGVPVYASAETLESVLRGGYLEPAARVVELAAATTIAEMEVTPFDTSHDAAHSLGFRIAVGERLIGYATDLGEIGQTVWDGLLGCHLVMLEANYDEHLLAVSSYPYPLKQRIRSNRGHLSNAASAVCISQLAQRGTSRFVIGHLSRENNLPLVAAQVVEQQLAAVGCLPGRDYTLQVAMHNQPSSPIRF